MPYTTSDLERVRAAVAGTELEVQFADGKRVRYRSLSELRRAQSLIESELAGESGQRRPAAFRVNVYKGV